MNLPLEELLKQMNSHFKLVLAGAKRANELAGGAPPLIVSKSKKAHMIALEEIAKGKLHCEELKETKSKSA
jgi:DNA-directed RNA polymerase omega subunit